MSTFYALQYAKRHQWVKATSNNAIRPQIIAVIEFRYAGRQAGAKVNFIAIYWKKFCKF